MVVTLYQVKGVECRFFMRESLTLVGGASRSLKCFELKRCDAYVISTTNSVCISPQARDNFNALMINRTKTKAIVLRPQNNIERCSEIFVIETRLNL